MSAGASGRRAVFLDRDGVINRVEIVDGHPQALTRASEFVVLPGVVESLSKLRAAGLPLFVVTNQPDVTRGSIDPQALREIHDRMCRAFKFDGVYTCIHDDPDRCDCRKPKPGMILQAAEDHGIDVKASFLIGDHMRDMGAGQAAGCTTIFIKKPYSGEAAADHVAQDLPEAAEIVLKMLRNGT